MYLGLNGRALFAPYQIMGVVAPRHEIVITSGSKKGTQIYYLFSLKSPRKRTPHQVRQRGPYGQKYSSTGHLHISKRPYKTSSNKKALRKKRPSMFPKSGDRTEIDAHFRALLNVRVSQ